MTLYSTTMWIVPSLDRKIIAGGVHVELISSLDFVRITVSIRTKISYIGDPDLEHTKSMVQTTDNNSASVQGIEPLTLQTFQTEVTTLLTGERACMVRQVEPQFEKSNDLTKYSYVVAHLESRSACEVQYI